MGHIQQYHILIDSKGLGIHWIIKSFIKSRCFVKESSFHFWGIGAIGAQVFNSRFQSGSNDDWFAHSDQLPLRDLSSIMGRCTIRCGKIAARAGKDHIDIMKKKIDVMKKVHRYRHSALISH